MSNAIYSGMFDTKQLFLKAKALNRLQTVLLREGKGYQTVLYKRCGVGLTEQQFDVLVQILVSHGWCTSTVGERSAVTITVNQNAKGFNERLALEAGNE